MISTQVDKKLSAAKAPSFDNPLLKFKEGLAAPAAKAGGAKKAFGAKKAVAGAKATGLAAAAERAAASAREAGENAASLDFEIPKLLRVSPRPEDMRGDSLVLVALTVLCISFFSRFNAPLKRSEFDSQPIMDAEEVIEELS